jgi:uncharacterized protein YehS (DUF1456 family)
MTNNDVLRSLRYLLNIPEAKVVEIIALSDFEVTEAEIAAYLKNEEEPGYEECPHIVMAHFLNGMVIFKRGKDASRPAQPVEPTITNNVVLKKLRVAFELKDSDLKALIGKTGLNVSKTELSAFFRKSDHRNYRECGDQFLRNLLKGLA